MEFRRFSKSAEEKNPSSAEDAERASRIARAVNTANCRLEELVGFAAGGSGEMSPRAAAFLKEKIGEIISEEIGRARLGAARDFAAVVKGVRVPAAASGILEKVREEKLSPLRRQGLI